MPRLPDYRELGSLNPNAGQRMLERPDRGALASARTRMLAADVALRRDLATDPDYGSWSARYDAGMQATRTDAAGLIRNPSDRARFEQDAHLDQQRGAEALEREARKVRFHADLTTLHDTAQAAGDEATRIAVFETVRESIAAAQANGDLEPERAGALRREWVQNYAQRRIEAIRPTNEVSGDIEADAEPDVDLAARAIGDEAGISRASAPSNKQTNKWSAADIIGGLIDPDYIPEEAEKTFKELKPKDKELIKFEDGTVEIRYNQKYEGKRLVGYEAESFNRFGQSLGWRIVGELQGKGLPADDRAVRFLRQELDQDNLGTPAAHRPRDGQKSAPQQRQAPAAPDRQRVPRGLDNWPIVGASVGSLNEADRLDEGDPRYGTRRTGGKHGGIDIKAPEGTLVVAAASGTVVETKNPSSTFGHQVVIQHQNGTFTEYGHLQADSLLVKPGDRVAAGAPVARVGRTGNTPRNGDSHLHFEVRIGSSLPARAGGKTANPLRYLPR
jgi:murein DD-endopeptidase MepM/ murein hydrolase activator NlpD